MTRTLFEWMKYHENSEKALHVDEDEIIPSTGYTNGRKYIGLLPPGQYKVINPIGGSATRLENNTVMLIPYEQEDDGAYEGDYYYVRNSDLDKLRK